MTCSGCIVRAPAAHDGGPAALLVALHGDSHDAKEMEAAWAEVSAAHGAVLFAPTCPKELHCTGGSWWRWFQSNDHDPTWLSQQIETVKAAHPIDPARVYATGYSGGASYLGYWAPRHATEIAAVAYVAGGYPYADACATCKVPVRILIGASDGMLEPYVKPLIRFYEQCGGHDLTQRIVPSVGHQGMLKALPGEAPALWSWFESHPLQCAGPAASVVPAAAASAVAVAPAAAASSAPAPRACACNTLGLPTASPLAALLLCAAVVTCVRARRPRTRRPRARTAARRRCP